MRTNKRTRGKKNEKSEFIDRKSDNIFMRSTLNLENFTLVKKFKVKMSKGMRSRILLCECTEIAIATSFGGRANRSYDVFNNRARTSPRSIAAYLKKNSRAFLIHILRRTRHGGSGDEPR